MTKTGLSEPHEVSLSLTNFSTERIDSKRQRDVDDEPGPNKRPRTEHAVDDLGDQHQNAIHREEADVKCHGDPGRFPKFKKRRCADDSSVADSRIAYWVNNRFWPKEDGMDRLQRVRARPRSTSRKRSEPGASTPSTITSELRPRDEKSAPYRDARYEFNLEKLGVFMKESDRGITERSRDLCKRLVEEKQVPPTESLFRDDLFEETCQDLQTRNEARVLRDIGMLLVPSAETLRKLGDKSLGSLIEAVNESWSNCIPLDPTRLSPARPQPDYSLGFRRDAFTEDQLQRLEPLIGDAFSQSYFVATYRLYFPFYTSEVKCGREGLDVADRQNAYSMAIAVHAIVKLFMAVGREKELDGETLAFSVSHDNESVRIYGWYPAIGASKTTVCRHTIRKFNFTDLGGRDKWVAGTFTKNIYRIYVPEHLDRIRSAVNDLPLDLPSWARFQPGGSENSGLSQQLEIQSISEGDDLGQITLDSIRDLSMKRIKSAQDSALNSTEGDCPRAP